MQKVRRIRRGEGLMLRDLRLLALRSDPDAFGSSYERECGRPVGAWERWAIESSAGDERCLFVAESNGTFLGMAGAYTAIEEPSVRHLIGMWVEPRARSAGIGRELVQAIVDWSFGGGAEEIHLWVVDTNLTARALYERSGFEQTGLTQPLPSNPSVTELHMALRLARSRPEEHWPKRPQAGI